MSQSRYRKLAVVVPGAVLVALGGAARADEATGKLVWFDERNSSLLLECPDQGCAQIPNAKPGETYTFVIPPALKARVAALKEGATITLVYDDAKEKGYVITAVSGK